MRNQAGPVVRGDDFFVRSTELKKIWRRIVNGNHILLSAPRRVGKTSLLRYMEDNPKKGYLFLYVIVQSAESEEQFYRRIIESLNESEFTGRLHKLGIRVQQLVDTVKSNVDGLEFQGTGIRFKDTDKTFTHMDLENILANLSLGQKLIIVIDEYPDVLDSILSREGKERALDFLKGNRSLCQNTRVGNNVQFIYTGSIGLEGLVGRIGSSALINDLNVNSVAPMGIDEAVNFVEKLLAEDSVRFSLNKDLIRYLLDKIEWLMPFYIQLIFQELTDLCEDSDNLQPTGEDIDTAFESLFAHHNRIHLVHWQERIDRYKKSDRKFIHECLNLISEEGEITRNRIHDLGNKPDYVGAVDAAAILEDLVHDGYIHSPDGKNRLYRFTSPILKTWWARHDFK